MVWKRKKNSYLRLIKLCMCFSIADFSSDIESLTTRGILNPSDGIGDGLYCEEKTFASILPQQLRNNFVNLEISLGIYPTILRASSSFLLTVQAIAYGLRRCK